MASYEQLDALSFLISLVRTSLFPLIPFFFTGFNILYNNQSRSAFAFNKMRPPYSCLMLLMLLLRE
jgi:hypothetical protein